VVYRIETITFFGCCVRWPGVARTHRDNRHHKSKNAPDSAELHMRQRVDANFVVDYSENRFPHVMERPLSAGR
jgi:hypothetical protein